MAFLKLNRKFFEHKYWTESRCFSKAEAWLDLIATARFEPTSVLLNGLKVEINRGELITSRRYLEQRWRWSNTKVERFLKTLETEQKITRKNIEGSTIVSLCNYDCNTDFEFSETPEKHLENITDDIKKTPHIKKEKKVKKEITNMGERGASLYLRKEFFYKSLFPFVSKYDEKMLRGFFDYWSEENDAHQKLRFEYERTWNLALRLTVWARKEQQFWGKGSKPHAFVMTQNQKYEEF